MLRLIGGCMIFVGSLGLGMWYKAQFVGRVKAIRELRTMLELLAGEVHYGRAALPECCSHTAQYLQAPFDKAFEKIGCRMEENTGVSFEEVFREEMKPGLSELPLKAEDVENFFRFTSQTGFADGQMQMRALEQSMELLRTQEEKLERENTEKCRMAVGLGAMSGLLLILVLW